MTRATKVKKAKKARQQAPPPKPEPRLSRGLLLLAAAGLAGLVLAGALLWNDSREQSAQVFTGVPASDPGPVHVHGLGIDPSDGALFIATHTGLFRVGPNETKANRVGDLHQDTMGFSVAGPNRFIGSGHPDLREARRENLPPHLGLIESTDGGKTWTPISLLGEADFHVLRSSGNRVYGYDASNDRLLASADQGQTWQELDKPGQIVDLAPDPSDPKRLVTAAVGGLDEGVYESRNGGKSWKHLNDAIGLVAWPVPDRLYVVDGQGNALVSSDGGRTLARRGEIGGQPAALLAVAKDDVYVALHDGTIKRSTDGGATWTVRSRP